MLPWFSAYNCTNYACYLSAYYLEMCDLPQTHPTVYQWFVDEELCVQRQQEHGLKKWSVTSQYRVYQKEVNSLKNKALLEPRVSPAFAITYLCNHCSIRFDPIPVKVRKRSLTPRWPLTPHLLRSHVWLYPRITVSQSHGNTSMFVDTVINFANYHIHTHTYIHTTYRMSDHFLNSVQARQWLLIKKYEVSCLPPVAKSLVCDSQ